jgi:hypothetical protein
MTHYVPWIFQHMPPAISVPEADLALDLKRAISLQHFQFLTGSHKPSQRVVWG